MHSSVKLIDFAKRYSAQHGKSVSQMISEYFKLIPPITHSLVGILKKGKISEKDYKKYLEDKYL